MSYDGILLIDKAQGWSSFDVVAKVRSILRTEIKKQLSPNSQLPTPKIKVGHTGTLDPLATGLMIVVVGSYCKRAGKFSKLDKVYKVQMKLGETSTTGDEEGEKLKVKSEKIKEERLLEVLDSFLGESMQVPPAFSAIKVDGKRAYQLAREGKDVKIDPRKVTIHSIELTKYNFPYVDFTVQVSSGTYIRSLVEDIGQKLGTGAYMTNLRRTKVGEFSIDDSLQIEAVTSQNLIKY